MAITPFMRRLLLCVAVACLPGCPSKDDKSQPAMPPSSEAAEDDRSQPPRAQAVHVVEPLLPLVDFCETRHRGLFIDAGSRSSLSHRSFDPGPYANVEFKRRSGNATGHIKNSKITYDAWLGRETEDIQIDLRIQGGTARYVQVDVDGQYLGRKALSSKEAQTLTFGPLKQQLGVGRHEVRLRFQGGRPGPAPRALLDWLRVYVRDNGTAAFSPLTRRSMFQDVVLGGDPQRSLALRGPGSVRCPLVPKLGVSLELSVGYWGQGEGVARVSVLLDQGQTVTLAERKVVGGDRAQWTPLILSLDAFADRLVALELEAIDTTQSGRVAFGEPQLRRRDESEPTPTPQNVVVVLNSGVSRQLVPPWGERQGLSNLFQLSQSGVTFQGYRANSTLSASVVASLLSGLSPTQHGLVDPTTKLPDDLALIAEVARPQSVASAMFTNVPLSFSGFGTNQGWSEFVESSPVHDEPGTTPLLKARQWLEQRLEKAPEERRLLFIHSTGGHPPWDVTKDEAATLEPLDYSGVIEPRRAAIVLKEVRSRTRASRRKLGPNDWKRLEALQRRALEKQDAALGSLFDVLKNHDQWDRTLVIWMGDVGMGDPPAVPFEPFGPLSEGRLSPPLIVKFAPELEPGQRLTDPVTTLDVARTLFTALGLPVPTQSQGTGLPALAKGLGPTSAHGTLSMRGQQYHFTSGFLRLHGSVGTAPALCNLEVDPSCHNDASAERPFVMEWLWRLALAAFAREREQARDSEPALADIDEALGSALAVYGL